MRVGLQEGLGMVARAPGHHIDPSSMGYERLPHHAGGWRTISALIGACGGGFREQGFMGNTLATLCRWA